MVALAPMDLKIDCKGVGAWLLKLLPEDRRFALSPPVPSATNEIVMRTYKMYLKAMHWANVVGKV